MNCLWIQGYHTADSSTASGRSLSSDPCTRVLECGSGKLDFFLYLYVCLNRQYLEAMAADTSIPDTESSDEGPGQSKEYLDP